MDLAVGWVHPFSPKADVVRATSGLTDSFTDTQDKRIFLHIHTHTHTSIWIHLNTT